MSKEDYFIWYKKSYYYNIEVILQKANINLKKYKESNNPSHPKCVKRIEYYKYIIDMLQPKGQITLF